MLVPVSMLAHSLNDVQPHANDREERLAAARQKLSKYQRERTKEPEKKHLPVTVMPPSSERPPSEGSRVELAAAGSSELITERPRARKESLSSSTASSSSTANSSSQYSFLEGDRNSSAQQAAAATEPLRADVGTDAGEDVLEAAQFDLDDAAAETTKLNTDNNASAQDEKRALQQLVVTEEELLRINLMYSQICAQLEQKAREEVHLKSRIDELVAHIDEQNSEMSVLKASTTLNESQLQQDRSKNVVENAQNESKIWHDQCSEWQEKYSQLQASFSQMQRQNLMRENEVSQQMAEMQNVRSEERDEQLARSNEQQQKTEQVTSLTEKLAQAETYIQTLIQERSTIARQNSTRASQGEADLELRSQILDLQARNSRVEAEKYSMYEQMLKQAIISEQHDNAAGDAENYAVIIEQLSAALHEAEAKLSKLEKDFNELSTAQKTASKTDKFPSAESDQSKRPNVSSAQQQTFTPALLEDLLRSKFVRMTNENADLKLLLDDKEDQMEMLRSECDTVIDYINVYQMQKLKLAEREARVAQLELQIKQQLERSVEYINFADQKLRSLASSVQQQQQQILPHTPESLARDDQPLLLSPPSAPSNENHYHHPQQRTNLFDGILHSVDQILSDLHGIQNAEQQALNQVHLQRKMYHAQHDDDAGETQQQQQQQQRHNTTNIPSANTGQLVKAASSSLDSAGEQSSSGGNKSSRPVSASIVSNNSLCSINNALVAYDGPVLNI